MRRGFDHKLLPPYRITRIEDDRKIEPDLELSKLSLEKPQSDHRVESRDYHHLLPLHHHAEAPTSNNVATDYASTDSTPVEPYIPHDQMTEYGRLSGSDLPGSARHSEDDESWQLPPTLLPEGGLSPF